MVGLAGLDQAVKSCFCMDDSGKKVCNVKSAPIIKKIDLQNSKSWGGNTYKKIIRYSQNIVT